MGLSRQIRLVKCIVLALVEVKRSAGIRRARCGIFDDNVPIKSANGNRCHIRAVGSEDAAAQ